MADIVNGKKMDRKKDLYNHVSFGDLYGYNAPIKSLLDLSKTMFTKYIESGIEHWKKWLATHPLSTFGHQPFEIAIDGGIFRVPITNYREAEDEETGPKEVLFSVEQIIDPYDIVMPRENLEACVKRLREYISIGLYPLVCAPMSEDQVYRSYEKYDECAPGRDIVGTIIDVVDFGDAIAAIIMWHPCYNDELTVETLNTRSGDLRLRDMIRTPQVWRDPETVSPINFGIPIYEYTPMRMALANINEVFGFADYINEAVVTGNLKLDFVDKILSQATETARQMVAALTPPSDTPADEDQPPIFDVPVIDASDDDELGHRLRLYDEDCGDYGGDGDDLSSDILI